MANTEPDVHRIAYGSASDQFGDLRLPVRATGRVPVAVVIHGGFWRAHRGLDMIEPLAIDLTGRGYATWNLEYGRVPHQGIEGRGGWHDTLSDIAAGMDLLVDLHDEHALDLHRIVTVGHSAGGHLALWTAVRAGLPPDAAGANPNVRPRAVVSLAGVADLHAAMRDDLGGGAAAEFLGGEPGQVAARADLASPAARLPLGVPQLLAHGDADVHVPISHARAHRDAATTAGDDVTLLEFAGIDHFPVIDPDSDVWRRIATSFPDLD